MNNHYQWIFISLLVLSNTAGSYAALNLKTAQPKTYGQKTIIKMDLQNTFTNKIDSVRAVVFLMDDNGKVVGQETRWIIGGTKDRPPLAPKSKATFNFVIQANKPFTKTKVTVTRLVLEGGAVANVNKEVLLESAAN